MFNLAEAEAPIDSLLLPTDGGAECAVSVACSSFGFRYPEPTLADCDRFLRLKRRFMDLIVVLQPTMPSTERSNNE